jgi:hypothetical protein
LGDARLDLGHTCIGNSRPVSKKKRPLANGFREPSREVKVSHDRAEDPQPRDPSDYRTRGCLRIGNAHEATLELSLSAERNEAKQLGSAVSIPYAPAYTTQAVLQDKRNSHTLHVETSSYEDRDTYAAIAAGFHKPKPKREAGKRNCRDTSLLSTSLTSRTGALWLGALRLEARLDLPGLTSLLRTFERFTTAKVRKWSALMLPVPHST